MPTRSHMSSIRGMPSLKPYSYHFCADKSGYLGFKRRKGTAGSAFRLSARFKLHGDGDDKSCLVRPKGLGWGVHDFLSWIRSLRDSLTERPSAAAARLRFRPSRTPTG